MLKTFTLEYWEDDGALVGRLREVPGVIGGGKTVEELEDNIRKVYTRILREGGIFDPSPQIKTKEMTFEF